MRRIVLQFELAGQHRDSSVQIDADKISDDARDD
jgi:hypothetical protein